MTGQVGSGEGSREFLQERVMLFGLAGGALSLIALFARLPMEMVGAPETFCVYNPALVAHACATMSLVAVALVCHRAPRSVRALRAIEAAGLLLSACAFTWMGHAIMLRTVTDREGQLPAQFIVLLATGYVAFARAVFVPSSGRRTMWLTAACAIGLLIEASPPLNVAPRDTFGIPASPYFGTMIGTVVWWAIATTLATLASNVIYGLRSDVRSALQFGEYTLEEKIGAGGMGVVYRARHRLLRRPTALKLLPANVAGARAISRFEAEVRETARLTHPNTVTIFDYGRTPDGVFYYAMELLDGETLDDILTTTGPMPPARVVHVLRQIAGALREAHGAGLVHRDVTPANVLLCNQGGVPDFAKVLDFGLVKDTAGPSSDGFVGTPLYVAPECIRDPAAVAAPADIYAMGAVGYLLLVGEPVFPGKTVLEICAHHLNTKVRSPVIAGAAACPAALEALVLGCLEKSPDARPTAAEALEVLDACAAASPWSAHDAASFWDPHRAKVQERRLRALNADTAARTPEELLLQIDLERR